MSSSVSEFATVLTLIVPILGVLVWFSSGLQPPRRRSGLCSVCLGVFGAIYQCARSGMSSSFPLSDEFLSLSLSPKSRELIWIVVGGASRGSMFRVGRVFLSSGSSLLLLFVLWSSLLSQLLSSSRFLSFRPGIESAVLSL